MSIFSSRKRFAAFVQPHAPALWRYGFWLTGSAGEAEELVQETLLRAWSALGDLRDDAAAKAWLFRILKNQFLGKHISIRSGQTFALDVLEERHVATDDSGIATLPFRQALSKLPMDYREPLLLQVADGMSLLEIGTLLGLPENTVATRVFRARAMLRDMLDIRPSRSSAKGPRHELR